MCGIATFQTAFTDATPKFRCQIPNLANDTFKPASREHQALIELYIPEAELNYGCKIRSAASADAPEVACSSWVYDRTFYERTIVTEWDLVCSNVEEKGFYRSLYFAGTFGVILIGLLGDRFGRKTTTYLFVVLTTFTFLLMTLSVNLGAGKAVFAASRFLLGFTANVFSIATVLAVEVVGPKYRLLANTFIFCFFVLGEFIVLFVAYFVRDYRHFSVCVTVLVGTLITYFWWIPESVRFLIGRKEYERADAIFSRIARSNKKVICIFFVVAWVTVTDRVILNDKSNLEY